MFFLNEFHEYISSDKTIVANAILMYNSSYVTHSKEIDMKVTILTDSNSGITQKEAHELGVYVIPMPFYINEELFLEDITLSQETHGSLLIHGTIDNPSGSRSFREDRDYLYPIPVNDRILSGGILKQNPGWDDKLDL